MLRPWEIEEISCVGEFYKLLMEELSDRIEEDFVIMVKEKMNSHIKGDQKHSVRAMLDWFSLWWYDESTKSSERPEHIDYLISRGMLAILKLTSASFSTVRRMIVHSGFEAGLKQSIMIGLNELDSCGGTEGDEESMQWHLAEGDSDTERFGHCNFGWLCMGYWK
ncbi:hypothetical protein BDV26DRAFT_267984 [Aspergillus bertholletiae]|uniref:Uncharacterized protein n=1 Tax=Aspergillus bertholletiae TaxID=1226010 RepID=A0A5N7B001_9EURO|nr:hypothetical protein BDV26DRAFT_267984 [Aspergillus bertholletiae]